MTSAGDTRSELARVHALLGARRLEATFACRVRTETGALSGARRGGMTIACTPSGLSRRLKATADERGHSVSGLDDVALDERSACSPRGGLR